MGSTRRNNKPIQTSPPDEVARQSRAQLWLDELSTSEQEREQTNSEDNGKQMVEQAYDDEESDEEEQIPMAEEIEELGNQSCTC
ncbi:unnamed protein product [Didymodactylos carnosus]|uniref:Uncharacterized protein n=1 Tax=Didymodactylos carnosus TaxID=1234261 RepID=A0A8S2X276_9BILA|nr:unnamed protein product [Didymodactylos carnosus]CAF4474931.1 unnamed protein product [Didymodactylos carnosus]